MMYQDFVSSITTTEYAAHQTYSNPSKDESPAPCATRFRFR